MIQTLAALMFLSWAQDPEPPAPPKRPEPAPERPRERRPQDPDRRDPFEGPRIPNPPQPPGMERRPMNGPMVVPTEQAAAWLKENEPETFRRWTQLQEEGRRDEAMRLISEVAPRIREFKEMKERDPKGFEKMMELRRLERESAEQAEQARRAPPEEREAAQKKLKETLGRLFDAREETRIRELTELKRRVEALEKAMADRKTNKDRIVERRRRELMGEKTDDEW